ncbi:sulfite exporter TauE/SafE family protein [Chelatococcus sp. SYSU_G07232]|uniref:Probable membrane transporter protein n=1 Tax=Chelatococcus albus TaxID=3047466 RepID=A0ABT7AF31_9HYPH|nr:sulfite exporter TauE/SafE family protein [Chelatococcus sp. SYSU_G07232]MDJ1157982.1 sulfite exporter TauE/SafE family protein [Chelatococcus sp. SYSU_G07232]
MQLYLPIAEMPVNMFLLLAMGAAVGFISGMFGVGGGFLMTPLLIFVGIPPAIAVATQTAQITASSVTGALGYWRRRALDLKLGGVLVAGGFLGTLLGVLFFNSMRRMGQLDFVIVVSYVTLFGVIGTLMLVESLNALWAARKGTPRLLRKPGEHAWYLGLPLRMRFHRSKLYGSVIPIMLLAVLIAFAGAVLGIGGGFILVPALIYLFRIPAAVVVGTSLFQILFTMLAATLLHAVTNQSVDVVLAILLIVGGVMGAQFGARAGQKLKGESFRLLLAILVLGVGLRFAIEIVVRPDEPFSVVQEGS